MFSEEPRFVKPLRIGNYDRNLVNEPAERLVL